jgi:hypothetical protein
MYLTRATILPAHSEPRVDGGQRPWRGSNSCRSAADFLHQSRLALHRPECWSSAVGCFMPDAALSTTGWAWWQDETGKFELGSRRCDRECRRRQRLEASLGLSTHPTLSCWAENWERSARRMPVREFAKEAAGVRAVTTASRSSGRSRKSANATGCFTLAVFRPDLAEHSSAAQCRRQSPGRKGSLFR